ncbi:hypothetical protein [Actinomycetospora cinnamomea]|uniref:Uncharacterized protein n=1 Tax=Actinomycetospora cinnamomea TaxID=663609 RepID=A0A2U1F7R7_9PSEU|nr:hypothetical protein [Actinomycetospora cinnamomea]PVZ08237.1 hypothetical protein C8D89_109120 [Actinomycetospora cinnamomea]
MTAADQSESRAEQRACEAAERTEWDRLSDIYFAHMSAIAPDQFHCFCGSLDDLRAAVAELDREAARDPVGRPIKVRDANCGAAHQDGALQDQARREQLTRWHGDDHDAAHAAGDADAE